MFGFLKDKEKWSRIRNHEDYKVLRDKLELEYDSLCRDKEIPQLPFSAWFETIKTGNRKKFEDLYFLRRKQMSIYALMSLIYPENEEYILRLEDILCEICNEYSWCVPIHLPADRLNVREHIDLFAAETGLYLAEIKYIFNERLNPLILERITNELDIRIIKAFKNKTFSFERFKSNWAAVCGGAVGTVLLYENPDAYIELKPRLENCMRNYLESIGEDGSVSEGMAYWNYGFGFYCIYNDMLRRYTFNRIDYFKDEKVKKLAGFFSGICMSNGTVYSYSDSSQKLSFNIGTLYYLNERFGVNVPSIEYGDLDVWKFSWAIRSFLYYKKDASGAEVKNGVSYYDSFQCYVKRNDKYAFAIKGGNNKEQHNHNDVGSFVIVADNKQLLCDLGAPIYTAHTLSVKAYDDVVQKASYGHNVPIINGKGQGYGSEYFGILAISGDEILVDMKDAYLEKADKLLRKVVLKEDRIVLNDEYEGVENFSERFVSDIKPEVLEGSVRIDCLRINFDKEDYEIKTNEINTLYHSGEERVIYLMDFIPRKELKKTEIIFEFDENTTRNGG